MRQHADIITNNSSIALQINTMIWSTANIYLYVKHQKWYRHDFNASRNVQICFHL